MDLTRNAATSSNSDPFVGNSPMAQRMRAFDWTRTSLGPATAWPQSLRSALSICIGSRFPIAIYWGRDLSLLYNDAWSPILGAKHPQALGRPGATVWPEIWNTIGPMFEQVLTTGESTYLEDALLLMNRHGYVEECYFNYTFTAIRGEGGETDGIFNAVIETTFRVIAERRTRLLQELGERLAAVQSTAAACTAAADVLPRDGADVPFCLVYLLDHTHRRARLCAAAGVASGSTAATDVVDLDDGPAAPWPLHLAADTGQVQAVERLTERFGTALAGGRWGEPAETALIAPLLSGLSTQPIGFLVMGVSPRRAADEEYRQFAARAAALIAAAATAAEAYEAERKRAESLAEIDRAKTVFFSNVSHEFRTPLTLLLGPLDDLLADGADHLSESQRDVLALMRRNGARLLKLVNTLLDFSRIEAGRMSARFEAVDLCAFTRDLASTFRSAMERAHLTFTVTCGTLPEHVFVDRDMWEKIVLNLLSNAFKFTLHGGVTVAVAPDGDAAVVHIDDTGVGIPEAELPRIFDRFHRVSGTAGRSHEGSGIGLALVHELVKLHGGSMTVASDIGRGTRFTVRVPFGTAHLPPESIAAGTTSAAPRGAAPYVEEALRWLPGETSARMAEPVGPPTGPTEIGRILLADDNRDAAESLAIILRLEGHEVELAHDGQAALRAYEQRRPDVALLDIGMPKTNGLDVARQIRATPDGRDVLLIAITGWAQDADKEQSRAAGFDHHLTKPIEPDALISLLGAP